MYPQTCLLLVDLVVDVKTYGVSVEAINDAFKTVETGDA